MKCYACSNDATVTVDYLAGNRFKMSDPLCDRCLDEASQDGDYMDYVTDVIRLEST